MENFSTDFEMEQLVKSEDYKSRIKAAEQGYGLEELVKDPDWRVRTEVAKQGYGLDKLVDDPHLGVRKAVASMGFGLDKLYNDPQPDVVSAVAAYCRTNKISLPDWIKANPDKCMHDWHKKSYLTDNKDHVPYGTDPDLDALVMSEDLNKRITAAERGYGLEILIGDKEPSVRESVAERGYGLKTLVNDESPTVRAAVAKQGFGLDKLFRDSDPVVISGVAFYCRNNKISLPEWTKANPDKCCLPKNLDDIAKLLVSALEADGKDLNR